MKKHAVQIEILGKHLSEASMVFSVFRFTTIQRNTMVMIQNSLVNHGYKIDLVVS